VFLPVAADALDWCGASRADPLPLGGADIGHGPAAELDLCLDAAVNALGELRAGQRMLTPEAGTRDGPRRLAPARPCRRVSR
jgi:hypothetical protein